MPVVSRTRTGDGFAGERIEYGPQLIHEVEQSLVLNLLELQDGFTLSETPERDAVESPLIGGCSRSGPLGRIQGYAGAGPNELISEQAGDWQFLAGEIDLFGDLERMKVSKHAVHRSKCWACHPDRTATETETGTDTGLELSAANAMRLALLKSPTHSKP